MTDNGFIPYWNQIRDDQTNYTYSIDNIVLRGKLHYGQGSDELLSYFQHDLSLDFAYFKTGKMGAYSHQFQFKLPDKNGFFVGVGMNTANGVDQHIGIDFNPNKVMPYLDFAKVYNRCLSCCQPSVQRFDLAIDIPVMRSNVFAEKDRRQLQNSPDNIWSEIRKSWDNLTTYWGRRSHVGLVKLYNKQMERKLNYPMTRIELTLDMDISKFPYYMPEIKYFDDIQLTMDMAAEREPPKVDEQGNVIKRKPRLALNSTDRVLLLACLGEPKYFEMLSYRKRDKILWLRDQYSRKVEPNMEIVDILYRQVRSYLLPLDLDIYSGVPLNNLSASGIGIFESELDFEELEV